MVGQRYVIFDSNPDISYLASSYCTLGKIDSNDFTSMMNNFPNVKLHLVNKIISNPYDEERDFFVQVCKDKIPYLAQMKDTFIRQLFYRANMFQYEMTENIFDVGDNCDHLMIVY